MHRRNKDEYDKNVERFSNELLLIKNVSDFLIIYFFYFYLRLHIQKKLEHEELQNLEKTNN